MLQNLGSDNCLNVLLFVLLQKSVMIHLLRPAVLTGVVEAISCIIFPFLWKYAYIRMLPLSKCDMIDAWIQDILICLTLQAVLFALI